jgi:ribosomal-protein-alanine N-acetyltransferase
MSARHFIRRATESDAGEFERLHRACFAASWETRSFETFLADDRVTGLLLSPDKIEPPVAFLLLRSAAGEAEILTLGTEPEARRFGHARALVRAGADLVHAAGARELFLEVSNENLSAIGLYGGLGFTAVGRRPAYYRADDGAEDALVLRAELPLCE